MSREAVTLTVTLVALVLAGLAGSIIGEGVMPFAHLVGAP